MNSHKIRTVVIPAAGLGTRRLPATKVLPKELLPIIDKPVIQFAVEEAAASGLETIILVVRPGKSLLAEHFERDTSLEDVLRRLGRNTAAEEIRRISELVEIRTVLQEFPLGLADAIRSARALIATQPFAVILPDALIDSEVPCIGQLMSCHEKHCGCIVATGVIEDSEVGRFGILELDTERIGCADRASRVKSLIEKPDPTTVKSRHGIFGRYILEPEIFSFIDRTPPGLNGEIQLTDSLRLLSDEASIYGYEFQGKHYDVGSKSGFLEATIAYALRDPELAFHFRDYMAGLNAPSPPRSID